MHRTHARILHAMTALLISTSALIALMSHIRPIQAGVTTIHYVAKTGDGQGGHSWEHAYPDLQTALALAGQGDEIWVASGVYTPGNSINHSFQLKDGVAIYGGFAATETMRTQREWLANPTILSGDLDGDDLTRSSDMITSTENFTGSNSIHVVTGSGLTTTAVLDGFTITAGYATGPEGYPCSARCGGGMYNSNGSNPTLRNLTFSGNYALEGGGGMYNFNNSHPQLTNITFEGNLVDGLDSRGGGMHNTIDSNPTLSTVIFSGNAVAGKYNFGGGMYNDTTSHPELNNVLFTGNMAVGGEYGLGGGMYNSWNSNPILNHVDFNGNSARNIGSSRGGGLANSSYSQPTLNNVTFSDNTAFSNGISAGGGLYNSEYSTATLVHVEFTANSSHGTSTSYGGGMYNELSQPNLSHTAFSSNTTYANLSHGGGLYNTSAGTPEWSHLTFSGNKANGNYGYGAGLSNVDSSPTLYDVTFSGNSTTGQVFSYGGGMYNQNSLPHLALVNFTANVVSSTASYGAGMYNVAQSSPTLNNVTFSGNRANGQYTYGGGIFNYHDSSPVLVDVTFSGNTAGDGNTAMSQGGGMSNYQDCSPTLTRVTFAGNSANGDHSTGGGMFNFRRSSPALTNVIFSGNSAGTETATFGYGGGLANYENSNPALTNVTFTGNSAESGYLAAGGGMNSETDSAPTVTNSIFWNNSDLSGTGTLTANISHDGDSRTTLSHSLLQGSGGPDWTAPGPYVDGGSNLDRDPAFITPISPATAPTTAGDSRLLTGSPAIDSGDSSAIISETVDLEGTPRILDGTGDGTAVVDMGAFEAPTHHLLTISPTGNGGGVVSSTPAGMQCGPTCTQPFATGSVITLSASAATGSTFDGWSGGGCSGGDACVVTMSASVHVSASFSLIPHDLQLNITGSGTVTSTPAGINCHDNGGVCAAAFNYGTVITLTAQAEPGWIFEQWGDGGTGETVFTITETTQVSATFKYRVTLPLLFMPAP